MRNPTSARLLGIHFFTGSVAVAVERVIDQSNAFQRTTSGAPPRTPAAVLAGTHEQRGSAVAGAAVLTAPSGTEGAFPSMLVVAPSAPGLAADLVKSASYREALTTADLAITDSGFMVLLWRAFTGVKLPRLSGLKFMVAVLARPELKQPGAVFWVMPSSEEDQRNRAWLVSKGFPVTEADVYLAPHYPLGAIQDAELLRRIEARKPRVVMLAIGGGVQERLGLMLRAQLQVPTSILCLGAAIAFLSGGQANIPPWADRMVLGWLLRLASNPRKFWRRYWEALALVSLLWRHRDRLPPLAAPKRAR
ncbi:MAG: WecB/TagA/CpsF family glycosyltransferase [Opitutus sp.]|nr:WecB/TagA/CpsF family glycosyltransferase [Opitutus sp.]MCS6248068.1 WecB/TagA/CpsF family glycosyltransferase [Opitutus sp.]MCS6275206.1 WecB/TagA/CpsF family glycosyltransferase [Opitutus sp.]MCS6278197.1 WecB/TagA/CpsF family glycosyltransferase [Opitutus sp.]MCS6299307.1 WecB/TagA/CpsF family glycosyltransferase [Opitutus sp.]